MNAAIQAIIGISTILVLAPALWKVAIYADTISRRRSSDTSKAAQPEDSRLQQARETALKEAEAIVQAAKLEAEAQYIRQRVAIRDEIASLAVKGAEAILQREVNMEIHKELLDRLNKELDEKGKG